MQVLLTGGAGFVGTRLASALLRRGDHVRMIDLREPNYQYLPSNAQDHLECIEADLLRDEFEDYWLDGVDAVVHLAGAPLLKNWSRSYKRLLYDSRVQTARSIVSAIRARRKKPCALVSASAIGIYGESGDKELTEMSSLGNDFLADLCKHWEREVASAGEAEVRTVSIRTAIVLGRGGFLRAIQPIFDSGVGGAPWVRQAMDVMDTYR